MPKTYRPLTIGWVIQRVVLAALILAISMGSAAWLMHHGIDPALEAEQAMQFKAPLLDSRTTPKDMAVQASIPTE